jgi:DNA-binding transcriptional ArsR family regulator
LFLITPPSIYVFKYLEALAMPDIMLWMTPMRGNETRMDSEERNRWVGIFSALASEPRLRIVEMLIRGQLECQEILESSELSQPAISYHLGKLEHAGILVREKHGTRNCYQLDRNLIDLIELLKGEGQG